MDFDWLGLLVAGIFVAGLIFGVLFLVLACISIIVGTISGGDYDDFPHDDDENYHHLKKK